MVEKKRALIVGMGIAGMATAIRLRDIGWEPLIVERSPERRTGGYFIGLFPEGKEAAKRLGALDKMHLRTPGRSRSWELSASGDRYRSVGFLDQQPRPEGVLRGDIEEALWNRMDQGIEIRYSTVPERIETTRDFAEVELLDNAAGTRCVERFDLVVGTDGLRSTVRRMVFGPHADYMKSMDAMICAFQLTEQLPHFPDRDAVVLAEPGRSLWIFPFEDRPPTALFTYRTDEIDAQFTAPPIDLLRERYAGMSGDGAVEHVLDAFSEAPDSLFDSVHQVKMPTWRSGRVIVLGDAAWCLTLYSGAGATAGMLGAVALGDAISAHPGDLDGALAAWEDGLRPWVKKQQLAAHIKGQVFVPSNPIMARIRRMVLSRAGKKAVAAQSTGTVGVSSGSEKKPALTR